MVREVMNGIMYILSTGCQWRAIPKDLPPRSTLFGYLDLWSYDGTLDRIQDGHRAQVRLGVGDHRLDRGRVGNVCRHRDSPSARRRNLGN